MPVYEYQCKKHGIFEAFNTISSCRDDVPCPRCSQGAKRVLSAPHLSLMAPHTRIALDRNDKSRHEPHVHTASCGHLHGAPKKPDRKPKVSKGRPWVLEHS
jgi:putative FmdB family regulatory protein